MPNSQGKSQLTDVLNRRHFYALIALCLFAVAYLPTITTLSTRWLQFDESYGHGLLIIGLFAYFFSKALRQVSTTDIEHKPIVIALIIPCSLLWYFAASANIFIIHQALLPILLLLLCLAVFGFKNTLPFLLPVSLLYFAIPIWDQLNNLLVNMTIFQVEQILKYTPISVYIEGNSVQISKGSFIIADGCSGLRYLIVGSTLAYLSAFTNFSFWYQRTLIIALGILLALIANWVRVVSLIYIGYASNMQSSLMQEHDTFGWMVFMLIFAPFFFVSWRFAHPPTKTFVKHEDPSPSTANKAMLAAIAISALVGPLLYLFTAAVTPKAFSLQAPELSSWQTAQGSMVSVEMQLPKPYQLATTSYRKNNSVDLTVYAYRQEQTSDKLLPYINTLYDKDRWFIKNGETITFKNSLGIVHSTNQLVLEDKFSGRKVVINYWFDIGGLITSNYRLAKLYQVPAKLLKKNHALIVIVSRDCLRNCENSLNTVNSFLSESALTADQLIKFEP